MNNVNKTLYLPLYGKAYVSRKGLFLKDEMAERIWAQEGFPLKGKAKSKWLAYYLGIRAAVFDRWLKRQMAEWKDAVVIHLGCGMDSRVVRVGTGEHLWCDVDFPQVIEERKRYFSPTEAYRMIAGDLRQRDWLEELPRAKRAILVMEGVSMYLSLQELQDLLDAVCGRFEQVGLLVDCYTGLAANLSRYKNPINEVGVTRVYGLDDPALLSRSGLTLVQEHPMTPEADINALQGTERIVFRKLYAGGFAKKLYRLFEYRKER